ncbi:unnamed protein product [Trichobilharzia regenti]|nr:unnamed protein product [Trichobilharzia regenti]
MLSKPSESALKRLTYASDFVDTPSVWFSLFCVLLISLATATPSESENNANLSETIAPSQPAAATTTTEVTLNNVEVEGSPKTAEVNETDANEVIGKDDNQHEGIDNQAVNDGDNKVKTVAPVSVSGDADVVNSSSDEPKVRGRNISFLKSLYID